MLTNRRAVWCSYDLRFPEVYQDLTFKRGAQILLMPSAFTKLTGNPYSAFLLKQHQIFAMQFSIASGYLLYTTSKKLTRTDLKTSRVQESLKHGQHEDAEIGITRDCLIEGRAAVQ